MSFTEIVVVIGGLFVGYWVVSKLLLGGPGAAAAPGRNQGGAPAGRTPGAAPAWHEILKVAPDATVDQIRESYRILMSQYHPDKVATLGEELRTLAETRTKEITAAYRAAMRAHGQDA
jgi:DnaJ like chaperone protein